MEVDDFEREIKRGPALLRDALLRTDADEAARLLMRAKVLPLCLKAARLARSEQEAPARQAERQAEIDRLRAEALELTAKESQLREKWQAAENELRLASPFNERDYQPKLDSRDAAQCAYDDGARQVRALNERMRQAEAAGSGTSDRQSVEAEIDAAVRDLLGIAVTRRAPLGGGNYPSENTGTIS